MSYFGRNIRKIRNAKKISQSAFADLFKLKRGSIGAYEEGRAEAKIDIIIEIAEYFQLSLDQILRKELTINEIYHLSERSKNLYNSNKSENKEPVVIKSREYDSTNSAKLDKRLSEIEKKLSNIESWLIDITHLLKQDKNSS